MIYVFYNNDPLAHDQGGGAEHFRGLHRALLKSGLDFHLVAARLQPGCSPSHITYVSATSNFLRFYLGLWRWFWRNRKRFGAKDVFHFHRNYAAWPKLLLAPSRGRVLISYHNVTGQVLDGWLGRLGRPIRRVMIRLERRVARLADAIICVSGRDRRRLGEVVERGALRRRQCHPGGLRRRLVQGSPRRPAAARARHQGPAARPDQPPEERAAGDLDAGGAGRAAASAFTLTIAGEGEDSRDLIRRLARSRASGQITWLGRVPHDEVPAMLETHGILLLTSRYEASPTVVKEALKAMRPGRLDRCGRCRRLARRGCLGLHRRGGPERSRRRAVPSPRPRRSPGGYRQTERIDGSTRMPSCSRSSISTGDCRPFDPLGLAGSWWPRLGTETAERLVTMGGSRALAAGAGLSRDAVDRPLAWSPPPWACGRWRWRCRAWRLQLGEAGLRSVAVTELAREPALAKPVAAPHRRPPARDQHQRHRARRASLSWRSTSAIRG